MQAAKKLSVAWGGAIMRETSENANPFPNRWTSVKRELRCRNTMLFSGWHYKANVKKEKKAEVWATKGGTKLLQMEISNKKRGRWPSAPLWQDAIFKY